MAQDSRGLYPHATPDGEPIPFEIVRPLGLITRSVLTAVSANTNIPAAAGFLVLRSDVKSYIGLDRAAIVPVVGTYEANLVFIDAGEVMTIDHNGAAYFTVIAATGDEGSLVVQACTSYKDIRKYAQMDRG